VRRRSALATLALPLLGGCGYSLVGKGVNLDPSIRRIGVPLFKDNSGRPGLDQKITEKVIEELLKRGPFDVVPEATGVDALVEGSIVNYSSLPIGFSSDGSAANDTEASRYAIVLVARLRYTKTGVSEPIWQSESFITRDEYDIGDDPSAYFDREEQAIDRLATSFARNVVAGMLEAF
jgi:hypothetical protein